MNQVAVTGVGVVSPIGSGVAAFWGALLAGRHAFHPIADADARGLGGNRLWAAVPDDFAAAPGVSAAMLRNSDRFTAYAMVATVEALDMAGLTDAPPPRTAVILGNTMGGLPLLAETQMELERRPQHVTPKLMALVIPNMAAARISLHWGLHGRQLTVSTACASSLDAIGLGARMIELGEVECAIVGGTETLLAPVVYQSLDRARAISRVTDPDRASRPFDVERDGFVMGEDAGHDGPAVVIGAGGIGVDVAHFLSHAGRKVTLMRRGAPIGEHIGRSTRWVLLQALRERGVEMLTGVRYERIAAEGVVIRDAAGRARLIEAARVVIAVGQEPHDPLSAALERAGRRFCLVGGARVAGELDAVRAFREGALAAREVLRERT